MRVVALALVAAAAVAQSESEPPCAEDEVQRCLELIRVGDAAAALPCFAPGSLPANGDEILRQMHEAPKVGESPDFEIANHMHTYSTRESPSRRRS